MSFPEDLFMSDYVEIVALVEGPTEKNVLQLPQLIKLSF